MSVGRSKTGGFYDPQSERGFCLSIRVVKNNRRPSWRLSEFIARPACPSSIDALIHRAESRARASSRAERTTRRVNRAHRTLLNRYMALASPPEIARPSSEMVVACTCNRRASRCWCDSAVRAYFGPQPPPDRRKPP